MITTYLSAVIRRTFHGFIFVVDATQILLASVVPLYFLIAGIPMPEQVASTVLATVGLAALFYLFLRLISATYFVWRDQKVENDKLRYELAAPERESKSTLLKRTSDRRNTFWDEASQLRSIVRRRGRGPYEWNNPHDTKFDELRQKAICTLETMSHDKPIFRIGNDILHWCSIIMSMKTSGEDERELDEKLEHRMQELWDIISTHDKSTAST